MLERTAVTSASEELAARDAVLAAIHDGILLFNPSGELTYANPRAWFLLGADASGDSAPAQLMRQAVLDARAGTAQPDLPESAGRRVETPEAVVEAIALPAQPPGSVVVVLRDVTDVRNVERRGRDFVTNASHELKTPVASILALAETLRSAVHEDPQATGRLLSRLEQEASRLAALVRDLLEVSRLEARQLPRALIHLIQVVETETERLRPRAESDGLTLLLETHAHDPILPGSESDLALLVHNLLDNAIRYTPPGGTVTVGVRASDGVAELHVGDTGIGIPAHELERIFERFYRVDAARSRQTGGTGLGLSIVRSIADGLGGSVTVVSQLGLGSTFTVRLPTRD
jgi:signal transduction histidine kinase